MFNMVAAVVTSYERVGSYIVARVISMSSDIASQSTQHTLLRYSVKDSVVGFYNNIIINL